MNSRRKREGRKKFEEEFFERHKKESNSKSSTEQKAIKSWKIEVGFDGRCRSVLVNVEETVERNYIGVSLTSG